MEDCRAHFLLKRTSGYTATQAQSHLTIPFKEKEPKSHVMIQVV